LPAVAASRERFADSQRQTGCDRSLASDDSGPRPAARRPQTRQKTALRGADLGEKLGSKFNGGRQVFMSSGRCQFDIERVALGKVENMRATDFCSID
jgi:hypothetical protein